MNKKYLTFFFLFIMGVTLFTPCYNTTANGNLFPEGWKEDINKGAEGAETWNENLSVNGMVKWVISALIGGVAAILLLITQAFVEFSQILLTWVTSEGFINIKFTSNPFVDIGWNMMRDLTNILIVLGLVVIALATILRISSYQMKKTLPLLLIVALLVNFTPMLCGVVIDASNIVMEHFLKAGQFLAKSYLSAMISGISDLWSVIGSPSSMLATGLLLVGTSLFSGIIFLLYAALFLFRYVALWMLVIVSPLALFCYIFPATKKIWNMWLSQFIQWCFIGIPAAFTIYLANEMTRLMLDGELLGEMSSMGKIMGYIVPVSFLAVGFFASLQTGAIGASMITSKVRQAPQKIGGAIAVTTGAGIVGAARGLKEGEGLWGKIKGVAKGGFTRQGQESGRETIGKTLEKMHVVRPGFYEANKKKRLKLAEEEKRMKELSPEELQRISEMRTIFPADEISKATAVKLLGDSGNFEFKGSPAEVKEKEKKAIDLANNIGVDLSGLSKSRPELTPIINSEKFNQQLQTEINNFQKKNKGIPITVPIRAEMEKGVRRDIIREQVRKISAKNFTEKVSPDSPKDLDVLLGMTASQIENVGKLGSDAKVKTIFDTYNTNKKEIKKEIKKLVKDGKIGEANKLSILVKKINSDPNFI